MKKLLILLAPIILASCGGGKSGEGIQREAKGGVYYGGVFRTNEVEDFRNLYPLNMTDAISARIANQIYEGLVKLNQKDLTISPSIAEKWDVNEDATVWTFHLRKGVTFHEDACFKDGKPREVTANDFKYCYDRLCEANADNQQYSLTFKDRVKGADEYYQSTLDKKPLAEGVSGVKVIDDYTLEITLKYSFSGFLNILTMPGGYVYPKEAFDTYGKEMRVKCVGTGAFKVKNIKEGEVVILEKNKNYWGVDEFGNQLPYLDAVKITFIKEKKSELLEFRKGNMDMIYRLPVEMISEVVADLDHAKEKNVKFEMQVAPAMSVFYYEFQHQNEVFKKKEVRLAFNHAIDREKIVTYTLQGEGIPGTYGIVPPSPNFKDYDFKALKGFTFDVEKAKQLMAKAGYPNGKGFPEITLSINNGGGDRNILTAEAIQKMLKENLNVNVKIDAMPFGELLERTETGKAMFWRYLWIADYPDPETFLTLFYGANVPTSPDERSYVNAARYISPEFDALFSKALREVDSKKRNELYRMADQVAIDDGAFMPIFYDEIYRLVQNNVKNFDVNSMEYRDFSKVYFTPKEESAVAADTTKK